MNQYYLQFCLFLKTILFTLSLFPVQLAANSAGAVILQGHVPEGAIQSSTFLGPLDPVKEISFLFTFPIRNQEELNQLLDSLYNPTDPLYGKYVTPEEFNDKFAMSQEDYDTVIDYAQSVGLSVKQTYDNRRLLKVSGSSSQIGNAFNLSFHHYQNAHGREFYAPNSNPELPSQIAGKIMGIVGLDNSVVYRSYHKGKLSPVLSQTDPQGQGTGPGNGLSPQNIWTAYNLQNTTQTGFGQTIGLLELEPYLQADITSYVNYFGLAPGPTVTPINVDGGPTACTEGPSTFCGAESTLDIELQIAIAPGASQIRVYQGPNSDQAILDILNTMVLENQAKQISTSWGLCEASSSSPFLNSENSYFQQMAAQGQSFYAAAGDAGAFDCFRCSSGDTSCCSLTISDLGVDDPASQPYVCGVGGTKLILNNGNYSSEACWNDLCTTGDGAGGGGVSSVWSIPSYQSGVSTVASMTVRNVPDVSLNSDPDQNPYSIYYAGNWYLFGGTSCAAPLWAGFNARVNQARAGQGQPVLGFPNPALYTIGKGVNYHTDFHDIPPGSTNGYYSTLNGYDNATGWGSFNGANLLAALAPSVPGANKTWVSGIGSDSNTCMRNSPCATFAGALSKTATHGEIDTSAPGDFTNNGTSLIITRGMTIDGGEGQVSAMSGGSGANVITVNLSSPNDVVILRNLELNGFNVGNAGIQFNSGGTLIIENCQIYGFTQGINWSSFASGNLVVRNCSLINNYNGLVVQSTGNASQLNVSVSNSLFSENRGTSIWGFTNRTSSPVFIDVENCVLTQNLWGISAASLGVTINCANNTFTRNSGGAIINGGGIIYLTANQIENNNYGALSAGGPIYSFGNNAVSGNVSSSPLTHIFLQ